MVCYLTIWVQLRVGTCGASAFPAQSALCVVWCGDELPESANGRPRSRIAGMWPVLCGSLPNRNLRRYKKSCRSEAHPPNQ